MEDLYHALNRGVAKLPIVLNDKDRLRFVHDLYVMNNDIPVENLHQSLVLGVIDLRSRLLVERKRLVTIHAWCLMGNHYHLLLSEHAGGGISRFLRKLNVGYAKYFNVMHDRSGALFQGRTKRILVENDRQFLYILPYIHLNPLDFMRGALSWRHECLKSPSEATEWIANYRWSSFRNYAGEKEFSEILEGSELFADRASHVRELKKFLRAAPDEELSTLNLE